MILAFVADINQDLKCKMTFYQSERIFAIWACWAGTDPDECFCEGCDLLRYRCNLTKIKSKWCVVSHDCFTYMILIYSYSNYNMWQHNLSDILRTRHNPTLQQGRCEYNSTVLWIENAEHRPHSLPHLKQWYVKLLNSQSAPKSKHYDKKKKIHSVCMCVSVASHWKGQALNCYHLYVVCLINLSLRKIRYWYGNQANSCNG